MYISYYPIQQKIIYEDRERKVAERQREDACTVVLKLQTTVGVRVHMMTFNTKKQVPKQLKEKK